jgi:hypothetical protein
MNENELPTAFARWIIAAVAERWEPELPVFGDLKSLRWNEERELPATATVRLEQERLVVETFASPLEGIAPSLESASMRLEFADGSMLESGDCYVSGHSTSIDNVTKTIRRQVTFTALSWQWRVSAESRPPAVWFAKVRGRFRDLSNVEVRGQNAIYSGGLWLDGAASHYFLVDTHARPPSERSFALLIFPGPGGSRPALGPDLRALEFCLGSPLQIDYVLAVDDNRRVIEVDGARMGEEHARGSRTAPAVPLHPTVAGIRGNWVAPLFAKLSRGLANQPDLLFTPLAYYVSSIGRFIDNEFLDLQVALEGFASKMLETPGEDSWAVKDRSAWLDWVDAQSSVLAEHAVAGTEQSLVARMKGLGRKATSSAVRDAFRQHGVELLPQQKKVVSDRNVIAHTALMNKDGKYEFFREMQRIAIVRSLLVALVSLAIGYRGQIRGWNTPQRDDSEAATADWWSVADEDQDAAMSWFIAGNET